MNNLAKIRTDKLMTQDELAQTARIGKTTISLIENQHTDPMPITKKKLAKALDVEVEELFPEEDSK